MIFNFSLNTTDIPQSFFMSSLHPVTVEPHQAIDISLIHGDTSSVLTPINSFLHILDKLKIKRFYLHRTFALGDVLMLVPVIRALRRKGYDPYIRTTRRMRDVLNILGIETSITEFDNHPPQGDYGILLDGAIERDHYTAGLSELHRIDIYFKALGVKKIPRKLDWSLDVDRLPDTNKESNYIVFQPRGSTYKKHLPSSTIAWLLKSFRETGTDVVLLGEPNFFSAGMLFSIIAKARALVCMDSSPLWISHFTKTPTLVLLGPSRVSERLIYHPLYPNKAKGLALNELINCESCFEQARKCNDNMDCLKINPEKIWHSIYPEVVKWL